MQFFAIAISFLLFLNAVALPSDPHPTFCGIRGYDYYNKPYDVQQDSFIKTLSQCRSSCLRSARCNSYALGKGACILYDYDTLESFIPYEGSYYLFYDRSCGRASPSASKPFSISEPTIDPKPTVIPGLSCMLVTTSALETSSSFETSFTSETTSSIEPIDKPELTDYPVPTGSRPTDYPLPASPESTDVSLPTGLVPTDYSLPSGLEPTEDTLPTGAGPTGVTLSAVPESTDETLPTGPGPTDYPLPTGPESTDVSLPTGLVPTDYSLPSGPEPTEDTLPTSPGSTDVSLSTVPESSLPTGPGPAGYPLPTGPGPTDVLLSTSPEPTGDSLSTGPESTLSTVPGLTLPTGPGTTYYSLPAGPESTDVSLPTGPGPTDYPLPTGPGPTDVPLSTGPESTGDTLPTGPGPTDAPLPTGPEPTTSEPTADPTAEPTDEPTPEPSPALSLICPDEIPTLNCPAAGSTEGLGCGSGGNTTTPGYIQVLDRCTNNVLGYINNDATREYNFFLTASLENALIVGVNYQSTDCSAPTGITLALLNSIAVMNSVGANFLGGMGDAKMGPGEYGYIYLGPAGYVSPNSPPAIVPTVFGNTPAESSYWNLDLSCGLLTSTWTNEDTTQVETEFFLNYSDCPAGCLFQSGDPETFHAITTQNSIQVVTLRFIPLT